MSRRVHAGVYLGAAFALGVGAYFVYPLFVLQGYKGFSEPPPTVVVFQDGSLGNHELVTTVQIDDKTSTARLQLDQMDVTGASQPGATTYIGLEFQESGYSFRYTALQCTAETTGGEQARIGTADPGPLWERGVAEGVLGGVPDTTGQLTSVILDESVTTVKIDCALPDFGFARESLAHWNLYLPGLETHALGGAIRPVASYSVGREPLDYLEIASQQPSEVLASSYTWYERDHDLLARQGLFLTVSSPSLQQESAYRLFIAGALVGLAGGLFVASVQTALESSPR